VAGGLALQVLGAGGLAAFVWLKVRRENLGGHLTAATIRLVWHGEVHTRQGLMVLVAAALLYAAGSIVMARPYVSRPVTLFVAVPLAAVAGLLVLGALALIVALAIAAFTSDGFDFPGWDFSSGSGGDGRRRRRRGQPR
jgi:hypothetical protein